MRSLAVLRPCVLVLRHHQPSKFSPNSEERKYRGRMKVPGCVLHIEDASSTEGRLRNPRRCCGRTVYGSLQALNSLSQILDIVGGLDFSPQRLMKVNIYHFVLLNINKVVRPGEGLQYFYWHIQINLSVVIVKHIPL